MHTQADHEGSIDPTINPSNALLVLGESLDTTSGLSTEERPTTTGYSMAAPTRYIFYNQSVAKLIPKVFRVNSPCRKNASFHLIQDFVNCRSERKMEAEFLTQNS